MPAEQAQDVFHDGAVGHGQEGFRQAGGEGTQASAFTSGHHDGFHGAGSFFSVFRGEGRRDDGR
ncbi:hypothetical protein, partial [Streptomyces sp. Tu 6176]|uniref:hypothetical protein n=1 Tax=Streptomyces sp. Tu 6176 TaxID=1470557 RepID=UPI001F3FED4E